MTLRVISIVGLMLLVACTTMNPFVFQSEGATSVEEDYHDLPLSTLVNTPSWIADTRVEKRIFLNPTTGEPLPPRAPNLENGTIHGVFIPASVQCPPAECPLIDTGVSFLYQHGNSGHLFRYWYRAVALWSMGANVFIYTYRGYGLSKGKTTRSTVLADARAAATYLSGRPDIDPTRIVAYGYSMGAIPTCHLVGQSQFKTAFAGAIIESGLDSPESILDLSSGTEFRDGFFFDETPFDGPRFIENATLPILHLHGGRDERVLRIQAERYYDVLKNRSNYTHYLGKTAAVDEAWIAEAAHRNLPFVAFKAPDHLSDYWDHDANPNHCCIHPNDFLAAQNHAFLTSLGNATGTQVVASFESYVGLVSAWIREIVESR